MLILLSEAILSKILENERAAKAMEEGLAGQTSMPAHHAPELEKGARALESDD